MPEFCPGFGKLGPQLMVQGVEAFGTVHPYHEDLPVAFSFDDSHSC
jgi:hypothetical protein